MDAGQEGRAGGYQGRAVPGQVAAFDQGDAVVGEHLGAVGDAEGVRLVGQDDQVGVPGFEVGQVDAGVAAGVIGVDVVQAEAGGQVAGGGARADPHPRGAPDRDSGADRGAGGGGGPALVGP